MPGTICFIRKRDEKCFDQSCFVFLCLLEPPKHRTEGDVVPAWSTTKLAGSISKFGWFGVLFCFFFSSAFKYQILPTLTDYVQLEYNSAISRGVYNIWILHVLKVPQTTQKTPTNNNLIILRGSLGLLPLPISKLRHSHTKKSVLKAYELCRWNCSYNSSGTSLPFLILQAPPYMLFPQK